MQNRDGHRGETPPFPAAARDRRTNSRRRGASFRPAAWAAVAGSLVALSLSGCGNITAGGFGEVQVTATGDADENHAAVSFAQDPRSGRFVGTIAFDHDDFDEPEGKLEIEFLASLIRADGTLVEVDDKEIEVELDLAGFFEADVVHAILPADRYVGLHIEFTEIEVEVERGVIIDGVPITGPIEVELEDDESIIVQRSVDLELRDGGFVEILLDMNARTWLRAMDPDLRVVAERVFADAIRVQVRR